MKEFFIAATIAVAVVLAAMWATAQAASAGTIHTDDRVYDSRLAKRTNGYGNPPAERIQILVPPFMMIAA